MTRLPKRAQEPFVNVWLAARLLVLGIVVGLLIVGVYVFLVALSPPS